MGYTFVFVQEKCRGLRNLDPLCGRLCSLRVNSLYMSVTLTLTAILTYLAPFILVSVCPSVRSIVCDIFVIIPYILFLRIQRLSCKRRNFRTVNNNERGFCFR